MIIEFIKSFFVKKPPNDLEIYGMFWSMSVWFVIFWIFGLLLAHIIRSTSGIDKSKEIDNNFRSVQRRHQKMYEEQQRRLRQEKLKNVDRLED